MYATSNKHHLVIIIFCHFRIKSHLKQSFHFAVYCNLSWAQPGFFGGGEHFFKNFQKFIKIYSTNFQNIFNKFSNNFQKISKNFQKITKNFSKNYKFFQQKQLKMDSFSIFCTKFNKPSIQFLRVWTKNAICCKFLRRFSKIVLRKLLT